MANTSFVRLMGGHTRALLRVIMPGAGIISSATAEVGGGPERDRAWARHHALRQGAAFAEELARVKGDTSKAHSGE
jgi:hypothetical protein